MLDERTIQACFNAAWHEITRTMDDLPPSPIFPQLPRIVGEPPLWAAMQHIIAKQYPDPAKREELANAIALVRPLADVGRGITIGYCYNNVSWQFPYFRVNLPIFEYWQNMSKDTDWCIAAIMSGLLRDYVVQLRSDADPALLITHDIEHEFPPDHVFTSWLRDVAAYDQCSRNATRAMLRAVLITYPDLIERFNNRARTPEMLLEICEPRLRQLANTLNEVWARKTKPGKNEPTGRSSAMVALHPDDRQSIRLILDQMLTVTETSSNLLPDFSPTIRFR